MKNDLEYFIGEEGKEQYNNKCLHCTHKCKQSYRATIIYCNKYKDRQKKK